MDPRKRLKYLKIGMAMTMSLIVIGVLLGSSAYYAWLTGSSVTGEITDARSFTTDRRFTMPGKTQPPSKTNLATVRYAVDGIDYLVEINVHVIGEMGLVKLGDHVQVAYDPVNPEEGEVIDYFLFSPIAPFLIAMGALGLLAQVLQWPFVARRVRQLL